MTAWHLTDWAWREIEGSTRRPTLTARAGAPIRERKQFQELVKRNCAELAYCEGIAISTKHFTFSKLPVREVAMRHSQELAAGVGMSPKEHSPPGSHAACFPERIISVRTAS